MHFCSLIGAGLFMIFGVRFIFILIAKTAVLFCCSCLDNNAISVYSS